MYLNITALYMLSFQMIPTLNKLCQEDEDNPGGHAPLVHFH